MRYVTVKVTAEDIEKARAVRTYSDPSRTCPVAQACHRAGFPDAWVGIKRWGTTAADNDGIELPVRVIRYIERFDFETLEGRPVQPATFRLPLP